MGPSLNGGAPDRPPGRSLNKAGLRYSGSERHAPGVHRVAYASENLIQLAEAFTGSKARFQALAKLNKLSNPDLLRIGTELVFPLEWIPEELNLRPLGVKAPLTLERDPATRRHYAVYTIRKNETLYSSVILRFTDREFADEVRRLAEALAPQARAGSVRLQRTLFATADGPGYLIRLGIQNSVDPRYDVF